MPQRVDRVNPIGLPREALGGIGRALLCIKTGKGINFGFILNIGAFLDFKHQ